MDKYNYSKPFVAQERFGFYLKTDPLLSVWNNDVANDECEGDIQYDHAHISLLGKIGRAHV